MKRILLFLFFHLVILKAVSQSRTVFSDDYVDIEIVNKNNSARLVFVSDSLIDELAGKRKKFLQAVIDRANALSNIEVEALGYNNLGVFYSDIGLYSESYKMYEKALSLYEKSTTLRSKIIGQSNGLSNIGTLYYYMGDFKRALAYNFKAMNVLDKAENDKNYYDKKANICLNIGSIYGSRNNIALARNYFYKAYEFYKLFPNRDSITRAYIFNNIADTYLFSGDPKTAEKFNTIAFDIKMKYGNRTEKSDACRNLGHIFMEEKNYAKAKELLMQSLEFCDLTEPTLDLSASYSNLAKLYSLTKDPVNENKYLKLAYRAEEYLDSIGNASEVNNSEIRNQFKLQAVNDSIKNATQLMYKDVELKQKKRESIVGIIVIFIILCLAIVIFNRYRLTNKQKTEIENQKKLVDVKNKEITESINYAKNLQDALMPHAEDLVRCVPDAFVLYHPKDIVAGDFYWKHELDGHVYIAAADSTGHGVPGALVSVVCINAMNRAVDEFKLTNPNEILYKVNELVNETFGKNNKSVNDGMDISLLCLDFKNETVKWCGANNRLVYYNGTEMKEIKPNKHAIGKSDVPKAFEMHEFDLRKGMVFYLFTDGYVDQFGGPKNKKMGFAHFRNMIGTKMNLSMNEQKKYFESEFKNWKQNYEQTDDVTLIGIKV